MIYFLQTAKWVKSWLEWLWYPVFYLTGRRPFSFGYGYYRKREIEKAITKGLFNGGELCPDFGFRIDERIIEYSWLFSRLPLGPGRLLDAGSTLNYRYIVEKEPVASKNVYITTLAPETYCMWQKKISYIYEDLRETCYRDEYFDVIASISTIEHIGMDNTMLYTEDETKKENRVDAYLEAIQEYYRILKKNGTLFLSFPFGRYANHGWFQVLDAEMTDVILDNFSARKHSELYFQYTPTGWRKASRDELYDATFFDIHKIKKYDPDYAAASRGVACLELIK